MKSSIDIASDRIMGTASCAFSMFAGRSFEQSNIAWVRYGLQMLSMAHLLHVQYLPAQFHFPILPHALFPRRRSCVEPG